MSRVDEILATHIGAALVRAPPAAFDALGDGDTVNPLRAVRSLAVCLNERIGLHDVFAEEGGSRGSGLVDQAV